MRITTVLLPVVLAASSALAAKQAEEPVAIHVHVKTYTAADTNAGVTLDAATNSSMNETRRQPWDQPWMDKPGATICRRVQDEGWFKDKIAVTCATRERAYNLYYQLTDNRVIRNCNCSSYRDGVAGIALGAELGRMPAVRCFATNATRTFADAVRVFNQTIVKCNASEFP